MEGGRGVAVRNQSEQVRAPSRARAHQKPLLEGAQGEGGVNVEVRAMLEGAEGEGGGGEGGGGSNSGGSNGNGRRRR